MADRDCQPVRSLEQWIEQVLDSLTIEDLPEGYQAVARVVGIKNAVRLSAELGGLNYYFPQAEKMLRSKRDGLIRAELRMGANYRDVAKKYHLSEVQIREIEAKGRLRHDQLKLFETA